VPLNGSYFSRKIAINLRTFFSKYNVCGFLTKVAFFGTDCKRNLELFSQVIKCPACLRKRPKVTSDLKLSNQ